MEFFLTASSESCCLNGDNSSLPNKALTSNSLIWLNITENELQFYSCERIKEAYMHGIETLVFIPTSNGVLEIGSSDVVAENWSLVQQAKALLDSDLISTIQQSKQPNPIQFFDDQNISFADIGIIAGVQEEEDSFCRDSKKNMREEIEMKKKPQIKGRLRSGEESPDSVGKCL